MIFSQQEDETRPVSENVDLSKVICKLKIPVQDAAKLAALCDMFPSMGQEVIISRLVNHSLNTLKVPTTGRRIPMNRYRTIQTKWDNFGRGKLSRHEYPVYLSENDAQRIEYLMDKYPRLSLEEIIRDLISAALEDVTEFFPYQQGENIVAYDELGDAIYEDQGLTPKFLALTKKHRHVMSEAR